MLQEYDGVGIYGFVLHYALLFALFGSSLLSFLYFWRKKKLGFDEEAKYHLFEEESESWKKK